MHARHVRVIRTNYPDCWALVAGSTSGGSVLRQEQKRSLGFSAHLRRRGRYSGRHVQILINFNPYQLVINVKFVWRVRRRR